MTTVKRIAVLLCGFEILEKSASTRGRDPHLILALPISAYLLDTERGYVLFDTGVNSAIINDPQQCAEYYTNRGWRAPVVLPVHEPLAQLVRLGVTPEQVTTVVLSHMHMDHTGNLRHFRHARIIVQQAEHAYAFSNNHSPVWFDVDYNDPAIQWERINGDTTIQPGIELISTPGHTPGHQSMLVTLPDRTLLLSADAGDMLENFRDEILPGETSDAAAALASIRRINALVQEHRAQLIIGHDPDAIRDMAVAQWR